MDENNTRKDSIALTPEELIEAINQYKAGIKSEDEPVNDSDADVETIPEENDGIDIDKTVADTPASEPPAIQEEKKQDGDVGKLIGLLEELLNELKTSTETDATDKNIDTGSIDEECNIKDNTDCSNDKSNSMNNDSADEVFRQRLSICRMGDKLHMDGLENKSIIEGKKAIIHKVFPEMRLDGRDKSYINAAYDLAVNAANKRKDVAYQKQQMSRNHVSQQRADGQGGSNAAAARQRMIDREGSNE